MNNSLYFEINGEASDLEAIPQEIKIIMISCKTRKTKSGTSIKYQFYGFSAVNTFKFPIGKCEIKTVRMRAAAPAIVRDYLAVANSSDSFWRSAYDKESN